MRRVRRATFEFVADENERRTASQTRRHGTGRCPRGSWSRNYERFARIVRRFRVFLRGGGGSLGRFVTHGGDGVPGDRLVASSRRVAHHIGVYRVGFASNAHHGGFARRRIRGIVPLARGCFVGFQCIGGDVRVRFVASPTRRDGGDSPHEAA